MPFSVHVLLALVVAAAAIGLAIYYEKKKRPQRKPAKLDSQCDCLDVMTEQWKSGVDIQGDLEDLKDGSLTYLEVSTALQKLVDAGLARKELIPGKIVTDEFPHNGLPLKVCNYKLTLLGVKRRDECDSECG